MRQIRPTQQPIKLCFVTFEKFTDFCRFCIKTKLEIYIKICKIIPYANLCDNSVVSSILVSYSGGVEPHPRRGAAFPDGGFPPTAPSPLGVSKVKPKRRT